MKKIIVRLECQEFMDPRPHYEYLLIDDTPKGIKGIEEFILDMNARWSGGVYSPVYEILTDAQVRAFIRSRDIEPTTVFGISKQLGFKEGEY